jgi:hypothetical protein
MIEGSAVAHLPTDRPSISEGAGVAQSWSNYMVGILCTYGSIIDLGECLRAV